jgi:DNA-binding NtrC family response regulator
MEDAFPQGTETILLVDDEEQVRLATSRILERLGYKVLQAATADQALHVATLSNAHLLLVDVVLPQMSGLKLAQRISTLRPGIHILYFSAHTSEEVLDDQLETRSGVGFIQKPFSEGEMARTVREILDTPVPLPVEERPVPEGTESILVVDDDPQTRRFMIRALTRLHYHLLEAQYPDRALSIARNSRVHLAVMDVVMPEMTGPELARAMAENKPRIRYLFVSDKAPEDVVRELKLGETEAQFLQKPFTAEDLGRAVRIALDAPTRS